MNDLHMWSYWRDKKGLVEALEDYYPDLLRSDPLLYTAYTQLKMSMAFIDARMSTLEREAEEEEYK